MTNTDNPAVQDFVSRVKRLRRVMAVFASGRDVLVLLDGDRHDKARLRAYSAQWETLIEYPGTLDLQMLDAAEYPDRELRDLIPTGYELAWAREPERLAAALKRGG